MMLQMMDSGSAEVLVQCQQEVQSLLSDFDAVASRFTLNTALACTDRYSANLLAERVLQHESSVKYLLQHNHCVVHKLASTEGKVLELVSYHLSGMVACGACMRVGGARATLRKHLFNIIAERLEIRLGMPQAESHRHHVYQLFLGKGVPGFATATPNNELSMRAARQRCILSHFMNGDISQPGTVIHMSPCKIDRTQLLEEFKQYVVPALVPITCPVLNRARFLNFVETISWVGLLSSHHNLFGELMSRFYGQAVQPITAAPKDQTMSCPRTLDRWEALAGNVARETSQQCDADAGFTEELSSTNHTPDPENWDWAEYNKATKEKAARYAASNVGDTLMLVHTVMTPLVQLLVDVIYLSSDKFEADQQAKQAKQEPRSFRITELANGKLQEKFLSSLNDLIHQAPLWAPPSLCRLSAKVLMFRMLARAGAMLEQLIWGFHRGSPYILFSQNPTEVLEQRPCLRDEITNFFANSFPNETAMLDREASNMRACLASMIYCDILGIESRHAASRRVVNSRSIQTWSLAGQDLSAEWVIRQHVLLRQHVQPNAKKEAKKPGRRPRTLTRKSRKLSSGGPWKAFCREHFSEGRRFTKSSIKDARDKYVTEKRANSVDYQRWVQVGKFAATASRMGVKAYDRTGTRRQSVASAKEALVVSGIGSKLRRTDSDFHAKRKQVQQRTVEDLSLVATAAATSSEALEVQQPQLLLQDMSLWDRKHHSGFHTLPSVSSSQPHSMTFAVPAAAVAKDRGAFQQGCQ